MATLTGPYVPDANMYDEMNRIHQILQNHLGNKSRDVVQATLTQKDLVEALVFILASITVMQTADPVQGIKVYRKIHAKILQISPWIEADFTVYNLEYLRPTLALTVHALLAFIVNNNDFVESYIAFYDMLDDKTYMVVTWLLALYQGLYPKPSS